MCVQSADSDSCVSGLAAMVLTRSDLIVKLARENRTLRGRPSGQDALQAARAARATPAQPAQPAQPALTTERAAGAAGVLKAHARPARPRPAVPAPVPVTRARAGAPLPAEAAGPAKPAARDTPGECAGPTEPAAKRPRRTGPPQHPTASQRGSGEYFIYSLSSAVPPSTLSG